MLGMSFKYRKTTEALGKDSGQKIFKIYTQAYNFVRIFRLQKTHRLKNIRGHTNFAGIRIEP